MATNLSSRQKSGDTGFISHFTPKLISLMKQGYSSALFRQDALAGVTVAIVALPLSMAIAIASGAKPESGLFAAVVGGLLVSALGGSRYQIGGPAGAFIVLVAATIERFGMDGALLAGIMAGFMLMALGFLRLGSLIRYIPYPVVIGFSAGIAVIIFASQLRDLLGLTVVNEPTSLLPKLQALWVARASVNLVATVMALASIGFIVALRRWYPKFPGFLGVVIMGAFGAALFSLPVDTIGSRFGGIPQSLPWPALPTINFTRIAELLPAALAFALLGGIESLLSAVLADGMTGQRHNSNSELVAQGVANIASGIFGGICVTGTIARTATNIRAGAYGPVAGMLHAVFVLLFMLVAAPLAKYIPLACLAAILAVVCWNMADRAEFVAILRHDRSEAVVLLVTFLLTIFRSLPEGIAAGVILGSFLFTHRMADVGNIASAPQEESGPSNDPNFLVLHLAGPLFYGSTGRIAEVLDSIGQTPGHFCLDLAAVPLADATAAQTLQLFSEQVRKRGAIVYLANVRPQVRAVLERNGLDATTAVFCQSIDAARHAAKARAEVSSGG